MSRLLTNLMFLQQGYKFVKISSHEQIIEVQKDDYYIALDETNQAWKTEKGSIRLWLFFFLEITYKQVLMLSEIALTPHYLNNKLNYGQGLVIFTMNLA